MNDKLSQLFHEDLARKRRYKNLEIGKMSHKQHTEWLEHQREQQEEATVTGSIAVSAVLDLRAGKDLSDLDTEQLDALVMSCEVLLRERLGEPDDNPEPF